MDSKQYKEIIRPFLSDKRFRHSVYVAEECIALASRYGVDEKKAETVGILHDIMKELPKEEQLKMMENSVHQPLYLLFILCLLCFFINIATRYL